MQEKQPHIVDVIFVLALFGLFAMSALALIITGSGIYQNAVSNMQNNYEIRTSTSYVTEKIRRGNCLDILDVDDHEIISIGSKIGDKNYRTYLYTYDGFLRELFVLADTDFSPKLFPAGQKITEMSDLSIKQEANDIYEIVLMQSSGTSTSLLINKYSGAN